MTRKSSAEPQLELLPPTGQEPEPELKSRALVELFGHQRIVGFLTQQTFGSGVLFRVGRTGFTQSGKGRTQGLYALLRIISNLQHHAGGRADGARTPAHDRRNASCAPTFTEKLRERGSGLLMTDTILLYARFTWGFGCICAGMLLEFAAELHTRSGEVLRQWAERVIEHGLEIGVWD